MKKITIEVIFEREVFDNFFERSREEIEESVRILLKDETEEVGIIISEDGEVKFDRQIK